MARFPNSNPMKFTSTLLLSALATTAAALIPSGFAADGKALGYQDTPIIPGTKWHVHDGERPQPKVITPGTFPTQEKAGTPPSDAIVLFDGKDLSKWSGGKGQEAGWKVENGYAEINKTGDIKTKDEFGPDVQLHVEWAAPSPGSGSGQGRGNSGIFLYGKYEIQVLDCYENPTYPDGQATAIYSQTPPLVNASLKPGEWQTYDIIFNGPRFENEKLVTPAFATIFHNGVLVRGSHATYRRDSSPTGRHVSCAPGKRSNPAAGSRQRGSVSEHLDS